MKAKQYFEELRAMIPAGVDARSDRNKVLWVAIDYLRELLGKPSLSTSRFSAGSSGTEEEQELMFEMDDTQRLR